MSNKLYTPEVFHLNEGDTLLLYLSEHCDLETAKKIHQEMQKLYPNNVVLITNENILEKISIIESQKECDPIKELEELFKK